ncbi:serine/threonine protein kinase [Myxococcus sp. AM009]|uniref:serine/threonine-protein kinase n=1 Tax=unclassified Myxococcus TaxID=2648731 RepID=UPI0015961384|nr:MULTISPECIES: serine/threonine-protein kinase [unclassified Myxococcus]NVJ00205.1 serine/threonine protein kinase [Myxococcus sp. AM009]NVJ17716.1 serine/threonine protein kinase [Myxococcus sp. AM010]
MSRLDVTTSVPVFTRPLRSTCRGVPASEAPPLSSAASLVGQQVGHFRLLRELGRGSLGVVLLAEHALIQKRVAIQVLHAHVTQDPARVARFLQAARTLTLIQDAHIVSLYDLGMRDGRPFLIMEYLEGQSLAAFAKGPLAPALVVDLLTQVCDALGAAHAHGIAHGSLNPTSIFLVPDAKGRQHVKLLDFGIAGLLPPSEGAADSPVAADLFAVGVLGALLVTGRLPSRGHAAEEPLHGHAWEVPPLPSDLRSALSRVLLKAMARRPVDRYASAAGLRDALHASVALDGGAAPPESLGLERLPGWYALRGPPGVAPASR